MKRLLSIVLALTVALGCFGVFAADGEAVSNAATPEGAFDYEEIKNELTLLKALGIVGADEDHSLEDGITRGEFAILAARIFGDNMQAEAKQYYIDVTEKMDCFGSVATLYRLGLISMDSSRTFEPNRNIEYNEACKVLVGLLGFSSVADFNGGYPYGYLMVAKKCGILNDVEASASYKNIIKMIYNTLNTVEFEVVAIEVNGDELDERRAQVDSTPLTVYHNVYKIKDTVKTTIIGSTLDSSYCEEDEVRIGNRLFKKDDRNYDELLGLEVTAYYKNVPGQDRTIICSFVENIVETEIVVRSTDDTEYKDGVLTYYDENGKERKITIAKTAPVIKNFDIIGTNKAAAYNIDYGKIIVRTQDSISKQNVTVMDCETYIVDYTDSLKKEVYGKYNGKEVLNLDEEDLRRVQIINNVDGQSEVFARIYAGDVLSVYRNADRDIITVYIGGQSKEGKLDTIKSNGKLVIDGAEYIVDPQTESELDLYIGMSGIFFMNMFGDVSFFVPGNDAWRVGYLYGLAVEEKAFSTYQRMLIFDTDANHNEYRTEGKLTIDGKTVKTQENDTATGINKVQRLLELSGDRDTYRQLIRFKVTDDGVITNIDTAIKETDDTKAEKLKNDPGSLYSSVPYTGVETKFATTPKCFIPRPLMDRSTIVFVVPDESDNSYDERDFAIKDKSYFTKEAGNYISAYETNIDYPYSPYIVARAATVGTVLDDTSPTAAVIVDEILTVINEDGEIVTQIDGYSRYAPISVYTKEPIVMANDSSITTADLKRGDIIRPALDNFNYILACNMVIDFDETTFKTDVKQIYVQNKTDGSKDSAYRASYTGVIQMDYSYIADKYVNLATSWKDNVATIPNDVLYLGYTSPDVVDELREVTTDKFVVYDTATDEIYVGTSQDAISWTGTNDGSMLFLWRTWGSSAMQIIYR